MNERIQTLLAKFKETESTHRGAHVLIGIDEIEKFAELIVRECQNRVEQYIRDCREIGSLPDTVIMKHFGVEE